MNLPEMHSAGKPLEERISAKCCALQKITKVYNLQILPHAYPFINSPKDLLSFITCCAN
jgi:hypothetical protein